MPSWFRLELYSQMHELLIHSHINPCASCTIPKEHISPERLILSTEEYVEPLTIHQFTDCPFKDNHWLLIPSDLCLNQLTL
jgi:hypothetical protein